MFISLIAENIRRIENAPMYTEISRIKFSLFTLTFPANITTNEKTQE